MNTIPQPAPLSEHADIMQDIFDLLEHDSTKDIFDNPKYGWEPDVEFVLAALDAFADEQTPAPRGTMDAE